MAAQWEEWELRDASGDVYDDMMEVNELEAMAQDMQAHSEERFEEWVEAMEEFAQSQAEEDVNF